MFSPLNYSAKVVKLSSYTDKQQSNTKEISMICLSTQSVEVCLCQVLCQVQGTQLREQRLTPWSCASCCKLIMWSTNSNMIQKEAEVTAEI